MKTLHIDSGILGENSVSRRLTAAAVAQLRAENSEMTVLYRDLVARPLAHLSGTHLAAANAPAAEVDADTAADVAESHAVLEEFLAADTIVIGAPMYNFSLPSQLKAWIDRIAVAGKTFRYTADGPEGLAKGKRVIILSTRGGLYSVGPASAMDHQESYLRTVFGFIGIDDVQIVRAEGLNLSADSKLAAISEAERVISGAEPMKQTG
ncbi:FMN-dependent NADH-azoreductase [Shinella daejeonensis]|uniref:FMN-dependent NADH-azoreductase n=1 Tax=Shinella daejeonensis TaxID=659017 RepID=UPI0020C8067E|nr:FMN-dependent NADH-azoreductase [Shinella daejeonensis]MCP8895525.1 FMN-dependent NADH-azoreductase [Shinella daejeonensis]